MGSGTGAPQGRVIDGRYRIVSRVAEGGMATVWLALDERLDRTVAVKVMHVGLGDEERAANERRFRREATTLASLADPHIVQVYDTGTDDGRSYLVMEYVHGEDLGRRLRREGTLDVYGTLRILLETLDGLAAAHRAGIIHRDIKPGNIMIDDRGRVRITDFGIARQTTQATLSPEGQASGTCDYMAPEAFEGAEETPRSDLYSAGVMAWTMLAGRLPLPAARMQAVAYRHVHEDVPPLTSVCPGISPDVSAFVSRLTARDPADRPADAEQAAAELRTLGRSLDREARQYRLPPPSRTGDAASVPAAAKPAPAAGTAAPPVVPAPPATTVPSPATSAAPGAADAAAVRRQVSHSPDDAATTEMGRPPERDGAPRTSVMPSAPDRPRRRRLVVLVAATLAALLAIGAGVGAWWRLAGPGSYRTMPRPDDVACSDGTACPLKGADWKDYEAVLRVAGIDFTVERRHDDHVRTGHVIEATADGAKAQAGTHVPLDATVRVVVSQGVLMATVPEGILDPSTDAGRDPLAALRKAGFDDVRHDDEADQYSETVPSGAALEVTPGAGTRQRHDDPVTVVLSKGPMPVSMPDVAGRTRDDAERALDDLRLHVTVTEKYSDTVAAGRVIESSVPADTQLHWGDDVTLTVSQGPRTVTIPDVTGRQYDEAEKTLKALGLDVRKSAPLGDITHVVRFQDPKGGQQVRVRDADGKPTVVTLTVV